MRKIGTLILPTLLVLIAGCTQQQAVGLVQPIKKAHDAATLINADISRANQQVKDMEESPTSTVGTTTPILVP